MAITSFQDLLVWQRARILTVAIYSQTRDWRDFGLRNQLERAAVSIMSNVAEGFSRCNNREFRYFLRIALGSCAEVASLLILATDLGYVSEPESKELQVKTTDIHYLLIGLWNHLQDT